MKQKPESQERTLNGFLTCYIWQKITTGREERSGVYFRAVFRV